MTDRRIRSGDWLANLLFCRDLFIDVRLESRAVCGVLLDRGPRVPKRSLRERRGHSRVPSLPNLGVQFEILIQKPFFKTQVRVSTHLSHDLVPVLRKGYVERRLIDALWELQYYLLISLRVVREMLKEELFLHLANLPPDKDQSNYRSDEGRQFYDFGECEAGDHLG